MSGRNEKELREKALEKLLARGLRSAHQPGGEDCPGADVLAAYYERLLDPEEASRWEAHFAACAQCQETLAALALSEPERARAAASVPRLEKAKPVRGVFGWRWLVPAAGLAAALAVWFAIGPGAHRSVLPPQVSEQQAESATQPKPAEPQTQVARNLPAASPAARLQNDKVRRDSASGRTAPGASLAKKAEPTVDLNAALEQKSAAPGVVGGVRPAAAAGEPPTPAEKSWMQAKTGALDKLEAPEARSVGQPAKPEEAFDYRAREEATRNEKQRAALATTETSANRVKLQSKADHAAGLAASQSVIVSTAILPSSVPFSVAVAPGQRSQWRVGAGGAIQHSQDAGLTWRTQSSSVKTDLLAAAAPSARICWIVGRAGTILRTTDGKHWERIASPAAKDWIKVEAHDADHAIVTAGDGQSFVTEDGGHSWQAR